MSNSKPRMDQPDHKSASWVDVGFALGALVPIVAVELFNDNRITPIALPFLLIGVVVGARQQWPLWSLWWQSWTLLVLVQTVLFRWSDLGRPPIAFILWEPVLLAALVSIGLARWQRGDGLRVAFALFPWALEFTRFFLVDDLPPGGIRLALVLGRVAAVPIYAGVATFVLRCRSRRTRWLALVAGLLAHFIVVLAISWPVPVFFVFSPAHAPSLAILAFVPAVLGLGIDGYRTWQHLSTLARVALLAVVVLVLVGLLMPWFTDEALAQPRAPLVARMPGPRQAIIVDTDMSFDDSVALLYLLQHPGVDIRAITIVNGVAHTESGLENVRRLLAMVGREDIPIAAGAPVPLVGDTAFPGMWRSIMDAGLLAGLPRLAEAAPSITASNLIRQTVADSPDSVNLVALGPLTNVAQALRVDPALALYLRAVTFSGGTIYAQAPPAPDDASSPAMDPYAASNLSVDPHAADLVFRSGVPLVIVPLDVTGEYGSSPILLTTDFVDSFAASARGRESRIMLHIMKSWFLRDPGVEAMPLWDVPAVAIAIDPNICTSWRDMSLRIGLEPTQVAGQTIIVEDGQVNSRVCLAGDQAAFDAAYLAVTR